MMLECESQKPQSLWKTRLCATRTYSYDARGNAMSIRSIGLTYDALDRMVEQNNSGYTQIVYGPAGNKLALMSGKALSKAFVPLAASATAVYNASGLAYDRHKGATPIY